VIAEIVREDASVVRLRMSERLWAIFERHRLSFGDRKREGLPLIDFYKSARIEQYADYTNGTALCTIGAFSYQMAGGLTVNMGRYCSVADHTSIMGERHPVEHVTTSTFPYRAPRPSFRWAREDLLGGSTQMVPPRVLTAPVPVLQHDVWTGNHALLQRGITLHTGCVVGAGAVVTKDVPPYAIAGGNPARIIRMRFRDDVIDRLLASRWWEYHPSVVFACDITDPARFLDQLAAQRDSFAPFAPKILTWDQVKAELETDPAA
jgi:acetyltransferase-like isoleucine patch superfamily enzyme